MVPLTVPQYFTVYKMLSNTIWSYCKVRTGQVFSGVR